MSSPMKARPNTYSTSRPTAFLDFSAKYNTDARGNFLGSIKRKRVNEIDLQGQLSRSILHETNR